tara:strand:- start:5294 stop:5854 length:561 start_codon:yes stop_codon:yes gene_type:complete
MITHYIKDTSEQYSIREDGKIFRNYKYSNKRKKLFIKREVKSTAVKHNTCHLSILRVRLHINSTHRKSFTIKSLMSKYFNISNYIENATNIYHIDGDYTNCHRLNLAYKTFWNREHESLKQKERRAKDVEKYREMGRKSDRKSKKDIDKRYAANILGLKTSELPEDLYQLKKINLQNKRLLKQKQL